MTNSDLSARGSQIEPTQTDRRDSWDSEILKRLLKNGKVMFEECKNLPGYEHARDPRTAAQNVRRRFQRLNETIPRIRLLKNVEGTITGLELFDSSLADRIRSIIDFLNINHQPVTKERVRELVGRLDPHNDFDDVWSSFAHERLIMPYSAKPYLEQLEQQTGNPQAECEHSFYRIEPNGIGYCLRCGAEGP